MQTWHWPNNWADESAGQFNCGLGPAPVLMPKNDSKVAPKHDIPDL